MGREWRLLLTDVTAARVPAVLLVAELIWARLHSVVGCCGPRRSEKTVLRTVEEGPCAERALGQHSG